MSRAQHALAGLCAVIGLVYLSWRVTVGLDAPPWISLPLLVAEVTLFAVFLLDLWATWPRPVDQPSARAPEGRGAILITAFGESATDVRACLLACSEVIGVDGVHLVDDAGRDDLRHLADRFGVRYHTRSDTSDGRSGAVAYGLASIDADFVAVVGADQMPRADLFRRALPLFDDDVAVVQIRVAYANTDSVIHSSRTQHDEMWRLDVLAPAAEARGAGSWLEAGAVVRSAAIAAIGGYPAGGFAGELVSTVRLQRAGWTVRYLDRELVTGLAPRTLGAFMTQRTGWARGQIQLLTSSDSPLLGRGLSAPQRLHHLHVVAGHLSAPAYAVIGVTLLVSLAHGVPVMTVSPVGVGLLGCWLVAASFGRVLMGHGHLRTGSTMNRNLMSAELRLRAWAKVATRSRRRAGGGGEQGSEVVHHLPMLVGFVVALEVLLAARLVDALLGWPLSPFGGWALVATLAWGAVTASVCLRTLGAFTRRRQDRSHHRVAVDYFGSLNGQPAWVVDLSVAGAGVVTTGAVEPGDEVRLGVDFEYATIVVTGVARSVVPNQDESRRRVGIQLIDVGEDALDEIVRAVMMGAVSARDDSAHPAAIQLARGDVVDVTLTSGASRFCVRAAVVAASTGGARAALEVVADPASFALDRATESTTPEDGPT